MAKQIEEKEEEYADLKNLTKRQKEEFDNLIINYSDASEKLMEIKKELEDRTKEIDELNEARRQAEKKAEDEFKIRTDLEHKEEINKIKSDRTNRLLELNKLGVGDVREIAESYNIPLREQAGKRTWFRKDELIKAIVNIEYSKTPILTPAKPKRESSILC